MKSETQRLDNKAPISKQDNSQQGIPPLNQVDDLNKNNSSQKQPLPNQQGYPQQVIFLQQDGQQQPVLLQQNLNNQPYAYQQPYCQPIIVNPIQSNQVIVNQSGPIDTGDISWPIYSIKILCPYCKSKIKTNVKKIFNVCTCCYYTLCIIAVPLAILNGSCDCGGSCCNCKNCCDCDKCDCNDSYHSCPNCNKHLGRYSSCCAKCDECRV